MIWLCIYLCIGAFMGICILDHRVNNLHEKISVSEFSQSLILWILSGAPIVTFVLCLLIYNFMKSAYDKFLEVTGW